MTAPEPELPESPTAALPVTAEGVMDDDVASAMREREIRLCFRAVADDLDAVRGTRQEREMDRGTLLMPATYQTLSSKAVVRVCRMLGEPPLRAEDETALEADESVNGAFSESDVVSIVNSMTNATERRVHLRDAWTRTGVDPLTAKKVDAMKLRYESRLEAQVEKGALDGREAQAALARLSDGDSLPLSVVLEKMARCNPAGSLRLQQRELQFAEWLLADKSKPLPKPTIEWSELLTKLGIV